VSYDGATIKMFFFPAIASVVLFLFVWRMDLLTWPYLIGGCVLVGVVAQMLAPPFSPARFAAALVNVGFALYFAIRLKLS
jgi:hypothetical protein